MPEAIACNLCLGRDAVLVSRRIHALDLPEGLAVVRCRDCGLMYLNPRPTQGEYAQFYGSDPSYSLDTYLGRATSRQTFYSARLDRIEAVVGRGGRLLEIGCATGHLLKLARERGYAVCGTELSRAFADYATSTFGLDVRRAATLADAAFPAESFRLIYANHVLEHLLDPMATFKEAARALKPGGLLFVEVPNQFASLRARLRRYVVALAPRRARGLLYSDFISSVHHTFFFTVPTLQQMFREAGLTVLQTKTYENHHLQVIGEDPIGGYWPTEIMHRAGALAGVGPIIQVWGRKP